MGERLLNGKKSLQEEDFKDCFSKIPVESRESMLNYKLKVINTQDLVIQRACRDKKIKSRGILRLLSEIWRVKESSPDEVKEMLVGFKDILKNLKGREREITELRITEYLKDNGLDDKIWNKAKESLIAEGIFTKGGKMKDVMEIIREKGRWEGMKEGMKEGIQKNQKQVILNMLKEKVNLAFISKVTGVSEKEIKKLKNNQ